MSTIIDLYGACSEIEVALDCLFRKQGYRPVYADNALAKIRGAIGDGLFPARIHAEAQEAEGATKADCIRTALEYGRELSELANGLHCDATEQFGTAIRQLFDEREARLAQSPTPSFLMRALNG